jgi:asparagine synthase (glutamine-hydrolysing)
LHDRRQAISCFFAGVSRLLPGEMAVITADGTVSRSTYTGLYADLAELATHPRPYDAGAREDFAAALAEAVRRRLVSDVPIGSALSGGLDSSTVVALVSRLATNGDPAAAQVGAHQQAFSAVFPGQPNDEERYVDAMAAQYADVVVHKVRPSTAGFAADLVDFVASQEEPVISTGPYAQYCVMREATQHVTVMLDGQGADEMLAGYVPYYLVWARQLLRTGHPVGAIAEVACSSGRLLHLGRVRIVDAMRRREHLPPTALLGAEFAARYRNEALPVVRDDLKTRLTDDLFRHSLPALLRYEDRNTMRFSVEGRVPFLSMDLLKAVWRLDDEAIVDHGLNKRAMRDATGELLPPAVHGRRDKIGFTTPEDVWFTELAGTFEDIFGSESFGCRPYFDAAAVRRAFLLAGQGRGDTETMTFWRLANVELWLRQYIDEGNPFAARVAAMPAAA